MLLQPHKVMEHAAAITYGGTAATLSLAGLHVNEWAMVISATCAVGGLGLQIYVAVTKIRLMKRSQRWAVEHRHDHDR